MGLYRARDLFLAPSVVSMLRLPLGGAFALLVDRPLAALAVLFAAGLSDVLDGYLARRFDQVTPTGAVVDPITDKLFVLAVVATLVTSGRLDLHQVLWLGVREIGELPLVVWLGASRRARRRQVDSAMANVPGKMATTLQFATVTAALFQSEWLEPLLLATAGAGAVAAASYWTRAVAAARR